MAQMQNFWIYTIAIIVLISAINYICHNCIEASFAKILSVIGYILIGYIIISSLMWNNSWKEKENESKSQNLIKNFVDILLLIIILTLLYNQFTK
jgi:predicted permease